MKKYALLFALAMGSVISCNNSAETPTENQESEAMTYVEDTHTYAQPNEAVVKHLDLDLNVNFEEKMLKGSATWKIEAQADVEEIIFDIYDLNIESVSSNGEALEYSIGEFEDDHGKPLTIKIKPDTKELTIAYSTGKDARALQWLNPEQTAGKKLPFLFTQSQAILARSWVPTQDSPGIRFTYNASVSVPKDKLALMSADNPSEKNESGTYTFKMEQPIPSYLLALAVGDVVFEPVSDRTGVYAEPSVIEKAVNEFADLEKMVVAAEGLYGPYAWGRYDLIVLPPSFPFGGMENPRLTFATPTILAGDRSLVSLVAHELAHSWSGNLVTNATWDDFWLNEGFTVYFEHRIMEEVYGKDYSEMLAGLTRQELIDAVDSWDSTMLDDTKLKLDLKGRNPDDGVTSIPYNKGYFFLRTIEETVGREAFDSFLTEYFDAHKFQVMDTERFLNYLGDSLISPEQYVDIKVDEWVYGTGIPNNLPVVESDRFKQVDTALMKFVSGDMLPEKSQTDSWTTHEWLHFINSLPREMDAAKLAQLDAAYMLSNTGNSEIAAAWFQPTLRSNYETVYPKVEEFLISVGRRKFLTPTYMAMVESGKKEMAMDIYTKARPNYHAVSRETLDEKLDYKM
jgi:leukotriene-A4 hydrolase